MEKLNVVVLCGGKSVESDISIITGYIVFKYSSNSDNFIFLERLEIYTSLE